jgi:predicted RNA binding protein YcfA (HicA-like mRNA interferase family)
MRQSLEQNRLSSQAAESSHMILRRDNPFAQVVVPDHKTLDRGTLRAIIRQAGLGVDEFVKLIQPG